MCGIAGFAGVDPEKRLSLTFGLGIGIDDRGGHAAGFVTLNPHPTVYRRPGTWLKASHRFFEAAAAGDITMMHARFATSGSASDVNNAHPFLIRRKGSTVLYGAHNGVIYDARDSARKHRRSFTVDSKELFELIADNERIDDLTGYGVITWMVPGAREVYLSRLTDQSEIVIGKLTGGGVVWASTRKILHDALDLAELKLQYEYDVKDIGRVYIIRPDGLFYTEQQNMRLADMWSYADSVPYSWKPRYYLHDDTEPTSSQKLIEMLRQWQ